MKCADHEYVNFFKISKVIREILSLDVWVLVGVKVGVWV